jgi:hypothetical protein
MLNKNNVVLRLCRLITDVGGGVFNHKSQHDCICGKIGFVNKKVIEFIEEAVRVAIEKEKS